MIRDLISIYLPSYPRTLIYMLQSGEYRAGPYLRWVWRTKDFTSVMRRRTLERTRPARLLLGALWLGIAVQLLVGGWLIYLGAAHDLTGGVVFGLAAILSYPILWAHLLVVPLVMGRELVSRPKELELINRSASVFANHPGLKIAMAGSY